MCALDFTVEVQRLFTLSEGSAFYGICYIIVILSAAVFIIERQNPTPGSVLQKFFPLMFQNFAVKDFRPSRSECKPPRDQNVASLLFNDHLQLFS